MRSERVRRGTSKVLASCALAALLTPALALGFAPPAAAADAVTETALTVEGTPEADGASVALDVTMLTVEPQQARPAIVLAHGFGGTKDDLTETGRALARDGYTVITYTARGFGRSGGLIHLDSPDFEGADAVRLVDFAATRPEVAKDGEDPVIGFAGASYGGAVSFLAAGLDPRVDAIAPAFTWNSLPQALFPQHRTQEAPTSLAGFTPIDQRGVFKQRWASLLFSSGAGSEGSGDNPLCGRFLPQLCSAYQEAAETSEPDADLIALLDRSSPARLLDKITAPTLIIAGEDDTLFPLDQADANLRGLPASTPAKMSWVAGGHDGHISTDALVPELESWFGRYLKSDGSAPDTRFSVVVPETSLVGQGGERDPRTLVTPTYPGRGSDLAQQRLALAGESQAVISPPGGTPTALTNLPGTGGALGAASSVAGYALGVLPGQAATFTTAPLEEPADLIGSGRIDLEVTSSTSSATLFASVWDLGPDVERQQGGRTSTGPSTAVLPQLAVAPVHLRGLTAGKPVPVQVALPAVAHQVPVGHRLQVVVSSTDQAYAGPTKAAVYQVGLSGDRALALPVLTAVPLDANRLDVPPALAIVVSLLALAAIVAMIWVWRRRRSAHPRLELASVPLVVEDLVKTYGDGFRAVDGISFRAEAGQVVGLLGPNGAGKTTAMRMLVGLIRPDSGSVFVHGEPVHAGADVLGSVGAFIEGPGFLPHLTGMANLTAFWAATGRPLEEAHLDEALAIAGLGDSIHRRVRGYSQGMRQRLGIAQAMLGLPRLLLLDEPTNGLDPPQIKAMRTVLADYAAAGRTVVVSSHLLTEVEHTCSHVVVMNKGKVVLTGAVADLTATDHVTLIELAAGSDAVAASHSLAAHGLVAEPDGQQIKVSGDLPRPQIVAELVSSGYAVESVDGRRQLEEVFLSLVGAPGSDEADHG